MPVLLVRHAHALARSGWDGDDLLRDLSAKGRSQADALVDALREYKPTSLLSSPAVRCVETLRPLGAALGLPVRTSEELTEGSSSALKLVREVMDGDCVLCSHGDVIPDVLYRLAKEDKLDIGRNPRNEKASTWVLDVRKGRFNKATYLRPPAT